MKNLIILSILIPVMALISCDPDDVPPVNEEENITYLSLTFTPEGGGSPIIVEADDPDGTGSEDMAPLDSIRLDVNTTYTLTLDLKNTISSNDGSITEEIEEEADEHLFFFSWTEGLFSDPQGNGNIDNRSDEVIYNDQDTNGEPLGLSTTWTTDAAGKGTFQIILKHQPDIKSSTSSVDDGETDLDVSFGIKITE